jgi:hypothetical protein
MFQTIPWKRKQLVIAFCGTKIEENFWNFVLIVGTGNLRIESLSQKAKVQNFKNSVRKDYFWGWTNHFFLLFWLFCKTNFLRKSVPSFGIDSSVKLAMPRNENFLLLIFLLFCRKFLLVLLNIKGKGLKI